MREHHIYRRVIGIRDVKVEFNRRSAAAEGFGDGEIALDGMLISRIDRNLVGVKRGGEFAGGGEADSCVGTGAPGQPGGAEEALQVDDQVKFAAAEVIVKIAQGAQGAEVFPG